MNNPVFRLFRFINQYFGHYKLTILLLAFLSFLASLLEGLGITSVIPMFSFVNGGGGDTGDLISQTIRKVFMTVHVPYSLKYMFILLGLLFVLKTIVLFISQYITLRTQVTYEKDARDDLLRTTLRSDWMHLSKQKVGHLEQILIMSVEQGSKFLIHISSLLIVIANLVVYGLLAVNISIIITFLTLILGVAIFYGFKPLFRKNRASSEVTVKEYKKLAHYINENVIGLKAVKANVVEESVLQTATLSFAKLREQRLKVGVIYSISTAILQLLPLMFIMMIFSVFYKTGGFTFVSFAVVVYAINRVFNNFQMLQTEIHTLISAMPYLSSAREFREHSLKHKEEDTGAKDFEFNERLEFKHVSFSYPDGDEVFSDITFDLKKGELLGLIGPSGAGKTTLVDLFLRLLTPQKGEILLDGVDISEIRLKEWRTNVGYVSQDIFLLNDTVANNIRFYSDSINDEDIAQAAKLANIYDFITEQPERFQTVVGERGVKLSVGQRQRIALARVLARKPRILILDEATSALDNESEIAVQKAIESLHGKITVIAIAHRLSTVIDSDRLIVLEKGQIVEEGKPKALLKDEHSYFSKVYNLKK